MTTTYRQIVSTLDHVAETLERRGSHLHEFVDVVSESVLQDLYEELERSGFDDFPARDPDVAEEVHSEDPSLIPDPTE